MNISIDANSSSERNKLKSMMSFKVIGWNIIFLKRIYNEPKRVHFLTYISESPKKRVPSSFSSVLFPIQWCGVVSKLV